MNEESQLAESPKDHMKTSGACTRGLFLGQRGAEADFTLGRIAIWFFGFPAIAMCDTVPA